MKYLTFNVAEPNAIIEPAINSSDVKKLEKLDGCLGPRTNKYNRIPKLRYSYSRHDNKLNVL